MEGEDEEEKQAATEPRQQDKDDGGLDIAPAVSRPVHEPDNGAHHSRPLPLRSRRPTSNNSNPSSQPAHHSHSPTRCDQSALHLAVDRGQEAAVELLIAAARERGQVV